MENTFIRRLMAFAIIIGSLFITPLVYSQTGDSTNIDTVPPLKEAQTSKNTVDNATTQETSAKASLPKKDSILEQIDYLVADIQVLENRIEVLGDKIKASELENDKQKLIKEREDKKLKLESQKKALEQIATGAVDLSLFETTVTKNFSWQDELKEIFRPVIYELKQLTEKPRQIEYLRNEIAAQETRLKAANAAIGEIELLKVATNDERVKSSLAQLHTEWNEIKKDIERTLQLSRFQLREKLDNGEEKSTVIARAFKDFFTGRGLNVLLAIFAFVFTFIVFRYLSHVFERLISRGHDAEGRFFARIVHVIFQFLTVILSVLALMFTLYTLGDWLVLALVVLMLVGAIFALRNSLPEYIDEVRLLLNIGPVREGERVIYNSIPYKVSRLNIYTMLVNPRLTGGRLRLPLKEIGQLISREWSKDEPWFPTKKGDFVLLGDSTFGEVLLQTPEAVQVRRFGGTTIHYGTSDYISNTPMNLSLGFGLVVSFGLDYELQPVITDEVVSKLYKELKDAFSSTKFNEFILNMRVEFDNAGASSLDLKVLISFAGDAAAFYFQVQRFIQKACVRACNKHDWVIPFAQLTVHTQANTDTEI